MDIQNTILLGKDEYNYIFPIVQEVLQENDRDDSYYNSMVITERVCKTLDVRDSVYELIENFILDREK